jgi:NAD(P)-dependent dehydrogenase (short-subunit alcohol dehydrogenase family)
MQGLEGQVALVTGGGSGIGRAIVHRLAAAGATVIAADVDGAAAEAVVHEVDEPGKVMALQMDVADAASVQGGVEAVHQTAGFVSVLVNNAGVGTAGTVLTTQPDDFWRIMAVNVYGTFLVTRAFLPDMLRQHGGTIVNVASVAGLVGIQNRAAYSASKGAVLALTRSLHADFHQEGIRVNAVVPGTVNTPWVERITRTEADPAAAVAAMAARQPIGRMGAPEEIAEAVYFLATPMSRFVYGSWLVVDGGLTAL